MTHPQSAIPVYRVFYLNPLGRIVAAAPVPAIDDDDARTFACALQSEHGMELWERGRRLAVYPRSEASIDAAV